MKRNNYKKYISLYSLIQVHPCILNRKIAINQNYLKLQVPKYKICKMITTPVLTIYIRLVKI